MTFILITFLIYCLITAKFLKINDYNDEYLAKESTSAINGIFVALVFFNHFSQYINEWNKIDSFLFLRFFYILGECVVSTFLFYSGYGMMEQIKKDKNQYLKKLITRRLPSLFIKFAVCVLLYVVLGFAMKQELTLKKILLSLIGYASVGNSAWYIFYMLFMYIAIYISFRFMKNEKIAIAILFLITFFYTLIMYQLKRDSAAYYLVSFVLPSGLVYSKYKEKITDFIKSHYVLCFISSFVLYVASFGIRHLFHLQGWAYSITAICFMFIVLTISLKIKFQNKILNFLGKYVFEIYILQRLPMIILNPIYNKGVELNQLYSCLVYFFCCLIITIIFAIIVKYLFRKIKL